MAALVAAAAGCGDGRRTAETLVFLRGTDSKSLDPAIVTDGESVKVITNIFDTLVTFAPGTLELAPALAERWSVSEDGRTWTFELREARFHDGSPVDADAVVFSYLRQKDEAHPAHTEACAYWQDNFKLVRDVRAAGPRKVEIELEKPFAPFLSAMPLFSMSVVSPTAWKSEGTDAATGKYAYRFGERPVGSGPFRFVRWNRDESVVLEANPDWWGGKPGVDRLVFKTILQNGQRLLEMENGRAHIMDGLNPHEVERVRQHAALDLATQPGLNIAYLAMNTTKKPWDDVRVRQAVAFALSKEKIKASAYDGAGDIAVSPLPRGMPGFVEIEDRPQDVAKAKELLKAAGHPDGFETTLWVMDNPRTYMPRPPDTATQIQQDLAAVGIRVRVNIVQFSRLLEDVDNAAHEMVLLGWMADYGDPDNFLYVLLDKENARIGSSNNASFYRGERYHELVTAARLTADAAERHRLYGEAQRLAFEEVPMIPLMQMPEMRVVSKRAKGYRIYPAGGEFLHGVRLE